MAKKKAAGSKKVGDAKKKAKATKATKKKAKATKKKAKATKKKAKAAEKTTQAARKKTRATKKAPQRRVVVFSEADRAPEGPREGAPAAVQSWPCVGRAPSRSSALRVELAPPLAVDWSVKLPAPPSGAPVVADDGVLYVGDRQGALLAFDVASGEELFQLHTDPIREVSPAWPFVLQGFVARDEVPVSSSPAVLRWHVFFGDDEGIFYCVRRGEAQVLWRKASPLSPAARAGRAYQPPFGMDDRVYVLDADGNLYAAEARGGAAPFTRYLRGRPAAPPALAMGRRALLATTRPLYPGEPPSLHALDAETGERRWRIDLKGDPGPALATTREAAVVGGAFGLAAYDLERGELRWRRELSGPVTGGLALDGSRAYAPTGGSLVAVDLVTGDPVWEWVSGGKLPELIADTLPICAGGTLWVAAAKALVALDAATGKVRARPRVPGRVVGGPIVAAGRLIVATDTRELRAYRSEA